MDEIKFESLAEAEEAFAKAQEEAAELLKVAEAERDSLKGENAEQADKIADLQTKLDEANECADEQAAEVEALQAEAKAKDAALKDLQEKDMNADRRAAEIVAASGSEAPIEGAPSEGAANEKTRAEFEDLPFADRADFLKNGGKVVA